ncbi:ninein-like protein isoform X9 [Brienomyrus brachyistius]|uniref:ninein-like protein isoform X9 n=1 Tax=Brienomyrus brachyistius TaxID=42636 RepID=UPI0020B1B8AE|nr:ninein-like protein isoform X9 [Brienomyrus brachyistius]
MENRPHFGSVRVADWEMEDEEQSRYVIQLKEEFDSCDSSGTGCLNKEELTALCHKLRLETQVPLLLATLLGPNHLGRVNFEEFKEGFVAVLSRSLDISTSEEDTSYLEPAVPEEVKPKFVKGAKRYGRRSRPDRPVSDLTVNSEEAPSFKTDQDKAPNSDVQGTGLRRSTSLESVESIKSDEETGSNKAANSQTFEAHGQLQQWKHTNTGSPRHAPTPLTDSAGQGMGEVWAELGVGSSGFLDKQELSLVCESIGLGDLDTQDMEALFRKLDKDQDGRVSLKEFQRGFFKHGMLLKPSTCSTPIRPQAQHAAAKQALEDFPVQSTSTPLLSDGVSLRLLTRLDNGSGCASPECVITVWSEEGVRHGREILQTLSFSLDEALNLAELTMALDNELLVSENIIHQAALVSYKSEIQFLQIQAEQACKERDKAKVDLERAERRNLQLVREVDEHHATMETLNESKIKSMEQEYRDRLTALRSQTEKESEVLLQQVDRERAQLQKEVDDLRVQEAGLQEEVAAASQENSRLEKEIVHLKWRLLDSETTISRLQKDLDHLLKDKFGSLDGIQTSLLGQEDRFADIIREYEQQCRELRDKNDELSSELEMLRNQGSGRKYRDGTPAHTWSGRRSLITESDSDDPEVKTGSSPLTQKKVDKNVLGSPESALANMSIKTELAVEHLKDRHRQEVQDLKIELETKVNYYERSLELMRFNMEVERRDISQSFKVEISEQEEQRAQAEEREARLQETVAELREQLRVATQEPELEQRAQHERAELEQSYAREISNLVQKLTSEKEQLQVELQLKMDQELRLVRAQLDEVTAENAVLKSQHCMLQQDMQRLQEVVDKKRKKLEAMEKEHEQNREEVERLYKENARHREESLQLSSRNLQLSEENVELSVQLESEQDAARIQAELTEQLSCERDEAAAMAQQLQQASNQRERELHGLQAAWQQEREVLEQELQATRDKLQNLSAMESQLAGLTLKHQYLEQETWRLQKELEERTMKAEQLQESLGSLSTQAEQLRSELQAVSLDRALRAQEAASHQKMLQEARDKVQELEATVEKLRSEKEQLSSTRRQEEAQEAQALTRECQSLQSQNQEMLQKVSQLQLQEAEVQRVTQESLTLKAKLAQLEKELLQLEDQGRHAATAMALAQSQHACELRQQSERISQEGQEQLGQLCTRLAEEQRRSQQLEARLNQQAQQASVQMSLQQEQYEKARRLMEENIEEVEMKLKNIRIVLQEKVNQLKEQLCKSAKSDMLLKELYVENAQLVKALQVTEQRQKGAERKNYLLEEKIGALNMLLRRVAPAAFGT